MQSKGRGRGTREFKGMFQLEFIAYCRNVTKICNTAFFFLFARYEDDVFKHPKKTNAEVECVIFVDIVKFRRNEKKIIKIKIKLESD